MGAKSIEEIVDILHKPEVQDVPIRDISSTDLLRSKVSGFIVDEMGEVRSQNILRDTIVKEIENKIMLHEMTTPELLEAYDIVSKHKTVASSSLLKPFEPVANAAGTLMPPKQSEDGNENQVLKNLDSKTMNTLFMVFTKMSEAMKNKEPESEGDKD
jgi:hypothetical protein